MAKDFPVTWLDIHQVSKALAWKLEGNGPDLGGKWRGIVAITRGGMVPACLVSRELGVRIIETISISSYDHQTQSEVNVLKAPAAAGDGTGWLVIDDLADTGNTFRAVRKVLPQAHFACLYAKPDGAPTADSYVMEVSQDTWIFLPWEDQDFPPHIHDQIGQHLKSLKK
jgi:xanthine phosphoribosyltransferase